MDISVLLSTYKRPGLLAQTLASFCHMDASGLLWEVLVVDNAGDGETRRVVEGVQGKLDITCLLETRKGKNNALNRAVEEAKGSLLVFTDDDIIAERSWLREMWEGVERWPRFSVFGGRILPRFPSAHVPLPRQHPFFIGAYVLADWGIHEGPYNAAYVWGPNMAVRAKIFREGWRFDPHIGPNGSNYIMGSETEFTKRMEKAGYRAVYLPKSLVHHQIRPEQMKVRWLYGRSFRDGRQKAIWYGWPDVPLLFGVPRYLVRQLLETGMERLFRFYDRERAVDLGLRYWNIRGMLHQYRKERPVKRKE
ncbi:MAG: glycosyltransferase [Alphaproteobacteria bacterium]|uniref:Glycosyltransferase n=1 Tax=Candidatus Nitrobium versatile TaxID=2884831 RepID=A0A953M1X2_9BACT|nr:glycosyltransferase [Candidatus Nitrobium versatile]